MSTLKVNNLQVGQDGTAANNYTLYQPASPDGTVRLGYGVAGSVTDILTLKNSRLGIGTNDPQGQLTVVLNNNGLEFNPGSGQAIVSYNRSTSAYKPVGMQGSTVGLYIGGVGEVLHITSGANVGIGTSNPNWKTTIQGGSDGAQTTLLNLHVHQTSTGTGSILRFSNSNSVTSTYGTAEIKSVRTSYSTGYTDLIFTNSDGNAVTEKVWIKGGTGRVGIGISNPNRLLQVNGASGGNGQVLISTNGAFSGTDTADLSFRVYANPSNGNAHNPQAQIQAIGTGSYDAALTFKTAVGGSDNNTPLERLRISSDGNINFGAEKAVSFPSGTGIQVYSSANPRIKLVNDTTGNAAGDGLQMYLSGSSAIFDLKESAEMRFYTSSTEKLRISSDGNVNIGNKNHLSHSSTVDSLQIGYALNLYEDSYTSGTDNYVILGNNIHYHGGNKYMRNDEASRIMMQAGTFYFQTAAAGTAGNAITFTDPLRITSAGRVGINVTSPEDPLHVRNSSNAPTSIRIQTGTSSTNNGDEYSSIVFDGNGYVGAKIASHRNHGTWNDRGDLRFYSGYGNNVFTERMRITNTGEFFYGANTSNTWASGIYFGDVPSSTTYIRVGHNSTGANYAYLVFGHGSSQIGSVSQNSSGNQTLYNQTSDYRLKENIINLTGAITRIKQLSPRRFNFIGDSDNTVDGFIAHEVATVVPQAVSGTHNEVDSDNNPVYQQIDQSKLIPVLTAALKEAITKIETLESRVAALEG